MKRTLSKITIHVSERGTDIDRMVELMKNHEEEYRRSAENYRKFGFIGLAGIEEARASAICRLLVEFETTINK